jgi:hypothetical protein
MVVYDVDGDHCPEERISGVRSCEAKKWDSLSLSLSSSLGKSKKVFCHSFARRDDIEYAKNPFDGVEILVNHTDCIIRNTPKSGV